MLSVYYCIAVRVSHGGLEVAMRVEVAGRAAVVVRTAVVVR